MTVAELLTQAVERATATMNEFANGNPAPWKQQCSHQDDVTIFGGFGGYERGWHQVGPRYEWASKRFESAQMTYENISTVVTPDLAYTVGLERYRAHLAGQAEPELMVLRVTHVFRREDGAWKVAHRHADALTVKQEAASNAQR